MAFVAPSGHALQRAVSAGREDFEHRQHQYMLFGAKRKDRQSSANLVIFKQTGNTSRAETEIAFAFTEVDKVTVFGFHPYGSDSQQFMPGATAASLMEDLLHLVDVLIHHYRVHSVYVPSNLQWTCSEYIKPSVATRIPFTFSHVWGSRQSYQCLERLGLFYTARWQDGVTFEPANPHPVQTLPEAARAA